MRGTARGHVNRRLVALRLAGGEPTRAAPLRADGKEVGRLTSVARTMGAGGLGALGLVRREHWETGAVLTVGDDDRARATVAALPLA